MPETGKQLMTDATETEAVETAPQTTEPVPAGPVQLPDDHPLVKTLAAQKELIRDLKVKAGRLDEIEEAQKSELQKALDRADAAEKRAADAEIAHLRSSTAARYGVPEDLLTGSTADDLDAAAQKLLSFRGTPPATPPAEGQGKQGSPVTEGVKQLTREDLKSMSPEAIVKAREEGRLESLMTGN